MGARTSFEGNGVLYLVLLMHQTVCRLGFFSSYPPETGRSSHFLVARTFRFYLFTRKTQNPLPFYRSGR